MAPSRNRGELLARVNFPLYTVRSLNGRFLLVAGGGGRSKTGIANAFEIYELSFDGKSWRSYPALRHDTADRAIMNCACFPVKGRLALAVGMEGDCQIYYLTMKVLNPSEEGETVGDGKKHGVGDQLRRRRTSSTSSANPRPLSEEVTTHESEKKDTNSNDILKCLGFNVSLMDSIQTDLGKDPQQKVVAAAPDGTFLATGGADGHLRLWKFPNLQLIHDIHAHKDEIDDLDIHPAGNKIVTISKDGNGYIWEVKTGLQIGKLEWTPPNEIKYRFRCSKYGIVEGDTSQSRIFAAYIPAIRQKPPSVCYLSKWNDSQLECMRKTGTEVLSAMAVSQDGRFVGVGTLNGSVSIYIAFNLQHMHTVEAAHNIFVTGLEFVPLESAAATPRNMPWKGMIDTALVSVSVDNQIRIHTVKEPGAISITWFILILIIVLFATFMFSSYIGL